MKTKEELSDLLTRIKDAFLAQEAAVLDNASISDSLKAFRIRRTEIALRNTLENLKVGDLELLSGMLTELEEKKIALKENIDHITAISVPLIPKKKRRRRSKAEMNAAK